MTLDYWNRHIERWMDIFSDNEPDLVDLELVREFDNMAKRFYGIFDNDLNESGEGSELYLGLRSELIREGVNVVLYDSSSCIGSEKAEGKSEPHQNLRKGALRMPLNPESVENKSSEDIIATDKNVRVVSQLPIINKKENIKVVTYDNNSITISYLNYDGKQYTRTLEVPYYIEFETAKAMYKNGILEITFDRK